MKFVSADFVHINLMRERGGMFELGIYERTKGAFEYFNLPFDGLRPN